MCKYSSGSSSRSSSKSISISSRHVSYDVIGYIALLIHVLTFRQFSNWPNGEGIVCCGSVRDQSETNISASGNYVICLTNFNLEIDIHQLTSDPQLILLGSCSAHG